MSIEIETSGAKIDLLIHFTTQIEIQRTTIAYFF